ncbi:hypothetical protein Aspvir_002353 [Aspergillus viridinutans]|uniref:Uncharacterized protein n=1 Tax=Aspergillus viridinutans TaxID=75553 RepID=A0A9P3F9K1_ASPVI|nr:uncharacterized protein Aspvir_002353 [Aspergillus viridinutans]GIK06703.1 hypothetical protein Aspvir_002353 [Aspergillus viridinutans]
MKNLDPETKPTGLFPPRRAGCQHEVDKSECSAFTGPLAWTPVGALAPGTGATSPPGSRRTWSGPPPDPGEELTREERLIENQALRHADTPDACSSGHSAPDLADASRGTESSPRRPGRGPSIGLPQGSLDGSLTCVTQGGTITQVPKFDTLMTFHEGYPAARNEDYEGAVTDVWNIILNHYFNQSNGFVRRTGDLLEEGFIIMPNTDRRHLIKAIAMLAPFHNADRALYNPAGFDGLPQSSASNKRSFAARDNFTLRPLSCHRTEVDRLEKAAAAEEAEVARKRTKAQELLKTIKEKEGKTGALVLRTKEIEMNME